MVWLQENWIIAVVGLVVAVILLTWLLRRKKPEEIAPLTAEPAKPAKPLEPVKPEIVAAEPARFKPIEPSPRPTPPPPTPVAEPSAKTRHADTIEPTAKPAKPAAEPKPAPVPKATAKPVKTGEKPAPTAVTQLGAPAAPEAAAPPPPAPTASDKADNLQLLKGVGPKLVALLNGLGVTSFRQIADWTDADVARIDPQLGTFQGRIARDNIVDQAGYLARGDKAGFEAKYGALGGEI